MSWFKVSFTTNQIEGEGVLKKLEDKFDNLFMAADGPSDMALLSENDYTGNEISIYFTPGCVPDCNALINEYKGTPCDPPDIGHVFLLAGNDDALDLLE